VTVSRPPSVRARILNALADEPMSTLQLAERAGITARRRGEVVKQACGVLEDEGLIERVGGLRHPKWRRPTHSTAETRMNTAFPPSSGSMAPGLDERLARELVQGLVRSAIGRGVDPAARLREFRMLQLAAIAMSQDPVVAETAERLVREIDLALQEQAPVKS
jgi:predicted ArsR family transcriptional regulator